MLVNSLPEVKLSYEIADATPNIGTFVPQNIMVDDPADQASRWGGTYQGHGRQWIVLSLTAPSILKSITFGKLKSPHPCNMNEFKVLGSMTMDNWTELLQAHLENSPTPETFSLRIANDEGILLPIKFVKIVPLSAHGSAKTHSFHPSIWYVALSGIRDHTFMQRVVHQYEHFRETTTLKFILKYLRERRLLRSFDAVLDRTGITLEHPYISALHTRLVLEGDFATCESLLHDIASAELFSSFIRDARPTALWTQMVVAEEEEAPKARGGHAMCLDSTNGKIYLHGGFDGKKSLDDFWVFDVETHKWKLICSSTAVRNGPVARSCHKMVFDDKTGCIYLLGKLGDDDKVLIRKEESTPRVNSAISEEPSVRSHRTSMSNGSQVQPASEFFRYHTRGIDTGKWDLLTFDTAAQGGPPLIYDHTMIIDSPAQTIYVFGGRVLDGDMDPDKCSGLYSYTIASRKWKKLLLDSPTIPPRYGHSMVFDPRLRQFFILAGQQNEKYLADMHTFGLDMGTCREITNNFTLQGGPQRLFSQRAVIDPSAGEIFVFHGLTKQASKVAPSPTLHEATTWMYRYASRQDKRWFQVLPIRQTSSSQNGVDVGQEPCPRCAHEVVYDAKRKAVWLFGGNAGNQDGGDPENERRLNDMWQMTLTKPSIEDLIRKAKFAIRRQQFRELSEDKSAIEALQFLQNDVSSVVDHGDAEESTLFRSLLMHLLDAPELEGDDELAVNRLRTESTGVENSEDDEDGTWTNKIPGHDNMSPPTTNGLDDLLWVPSTHTSDNVVRDSGPNSPSGDRFKQRHAVFESLLQYVSEGSKQPEDDLLDVVDLFRSSRSSR